MVNTSCKAQVQTDFQPNAATAATYYKAYFVQMHEETALREI